MPPAPASDGRRARWADHNEERRLAVLRAAVTVIEDLPVGSELPVQEIAARAGLVRTVVYRHYKGRAELGRAVQAHVVDQIRDALEPQMQVAGTPFAIIEGLVGAYVDWVVAHPQLHDLSEREFGDGRPGPISTAVDEIARQVTALMSAVAAHRGITLGEPEARALDLLAVGLIGQVRGTVSQWIRRPDDGIAPAAVAAMMSRWIWFQIDGQTRELGFALDPSAPLA